MGFINVNYNNKVWGWKTIPALENKHNLIKCVIIKKEEKEKTPCRLKTYSLR